MILDSFRITDKIALVTGAGRGIGRATAIAFAEAGADVVLAARRAAPLEEVAAEIGKRGRKALVVQTDVTKPAELDRLVNKAIEAFGRVDILVNNAGGTAPMMATALSDEELAAAFQFNVGAAFHLSRALAPVMAKHGGGCIVNMSSAMGHLVDSGFVAYGASKAALDHMTRLLALEWAPKVRVNAVAAGATLTDALEAFVQMPGLLDQMVGMTPMARLGKPEDIAAAVLYLASPAGSWITGKVLEVDGGTVTTNWPYKIPGGL